jgi:hypothetical protein
VCKFSFASVANAMLAIRVLFEEHAVGFCQPLHVGRELLDLTALIAREFHRDRPSNARAATARAVSARRRKRRESFKA